MKATIVPITEGNLEEVSKATIKWGFPRSVRWVRRLLFDPTVPEGRESKSRGGLIISEKGQCVGLYCWTPYSVYLRQKRIPAYIGALLGVERKYSPWLFDVIDRNINEVGGRLSFGNDCATEKAYKFWSLMGTIWGPKDGCYIDKLVASFGGFAYLLIKHALCRIGIKSLVLPKLASLLAWPINMVGEIILTLAHAIYNLFSKKTWHIMKESGFSDERFGLFWRRFLTANKGIVSSREPATLRWKFDESIKAGTVILFSAVKDGKVDGYVLLRRYGAPGWPFCAEYSICDICAIGNDIECLRELFRAVMLYARRHMAASVTYVGAACNKEKWIPKWFHIKALLPCNPFSYSVKDLDLLRTIKENCGWFFGPYDGERCLGYGRYIDL